jgi:hypothetical protein
MDTSVNKNQINDECRDFDIDVNLVCPIDDEEGDADECINEEAGKRLTKTFSSKTINEEDDEETIEKVIENLPSDLKPLKECMINAQGCCLLLILKQFLKEVYSITDL